MSNQATIRANQSDERLQEVYAQVLAALERLLDDDVSFTELSVRRLAEEAGFSRAKFYIYFPSKAEVLRAMAVQVIAEMLATAQPWWKDEGDVTEPGLRTKLRTVVEAYVPHRNVLAAVVESAAYDPAVREAFDGMMTRATGELADHLRRAQATGGVDAGLDAAMAASWLAWMLERGLADLTSITQDVDGITDSLTTVLWNALYRQEA